MSDSFDYIPTESSSSVPSIPLDTGAAAPAYLPGQAWWDATNHTWTIDLENNVRMQVGQETPVPCTNLSGSTLLNGRMVYINGYGTDHMAVALAKADASATSDSMLGMATQDIANLATGYVTTSGFVRDVDTSAFSAGAPLYLSAATAGAITATRPSYPNYAIRIGFCGRSHATLGSVWIAPQVFPDAQQILLPQVGDPNELVNIIDFVRHSWSTGLADGGALTNNGDGTVSIAACDFVVRAGTAEDDDLFMYRISASSPISCTADNVTYIYLDWNSGTPVWATGSTLSDFNGIDKVITYVVGRNTSLSTLNVLDLRGINVDANRKNRRQKAEYDGFTFRGFYRSILGTSALGSSGLNLLTGTGKYYYFDNPITHTAFDTTVAGALLPNNFIYFYNRTGSWTQITGSKSINATQFDSAGTLTTMTNNKWRADWVYVVLCVNNPYLAVVLGNAEYATQAEAQASAAPSNLPPQLDGVAVLIGQVAIMKSAAVVSILQAGATGFSGSSGTAVIADRSVTFTKLEEIAADKILGRNEVSAGDCEELTPAEVNTMLATITQGKHCFYVPARAMDNTMANGAAAGSFETASGIIVSTLDFDATTQEYAQFEVKMPKSWNLGSVGMTFDWCHAATTTNFGVMFGFQAVAIGDGEALSATLPAFTGIADTGGTTDYKYSTVECTPVTVGGTLAAEDWVVFKISRKPDNVLDTMAVDARLLGVTVFYTINAATDA